MDDTEVYKSPTIDTDTLEEHNFKRWNIIGAWRLVSKWYLFFLTLMTFLALWYLRYMSMTDFMEAQGVDIIAIGRVNILLSLTPDFLGLIFDFFIIVFSGAIPMAIVSYYQTKKACVLAQILWACIIFGGLYALFSRFT